VNVLKSVTLLKQRLELQKYTLSILIMTRHTIMHRANLVEVLTVGPTYSKR